MSEREGQGGTAGAQEEKGVNRASTQVEKRTSESMSYGTTRATRVVFVYPFDSAGGSFRRVATEVPAACNSESYLRFYCLLHYSAFFDRSYVPCPR